jgi:iron complex transport system substrate-binding protein
LPSIGGWDNPSLEKIAALQPDAVLVDEAEGGLLEDKLRGLGVRLVIVPTRAVADVYRAIAQLGTLTGREQQAGKLVASTRAGVDAVARKTAALSRPSVLLIVDRVPGTLRELYTATEGSYLAELVNIAGGRMAVPPARRGYGKLSQEDLIAANPDVILDLSHGPAARSSADPVAAWREMPELKAVRTGRVIAVDEDYVPHASQRIVQTAELFARLIHPEVK